MRNETVAAANIQNLRTSGNHARNLQGHIVGPPDPSPPPLASPTSFDSFD
jgi:hypothetical protein